MQSYKMNQGAHYIAHLKIVEDNKLAMKEFDRRVPFEIEDLAMAAGLESTLPSRSATSSFFCLAPSTACLHNLPAIVSIYLAPCSRACKVLTFG